MSHWNYRVVEEDSFLSIHEVYYTDAGEIDGWTDATHAGGESVKELRRELEMMLRALDKPVLRVKDDKLVEAAP